MLAPPGMHPRSSAVRCHTLLFLHHPGTVSTVFDSAAAEALRARLHRLRPDSPRRWGKMTPHQAVVHLIDSFRVGFGEMELTAPPLGLLKYPMRFAAFTLPIPWPKGAKTAPELDQAKGAPGGSVPGDFEADVAELDALLTRYIATGGDLPEHPVWGQMPRGMAGRYAWRHMDHHLRQFGV